MPNTVNITLTNTFEEWRVKDNEIGAALGDLDNINSNAKTGEDTVIATLNNLRTETTNNAGWLGDISTLFDSYGNVVEAINNAHADISTIAAVSNIDIDSATVANYDGTETSWIDILNAHYARLNTKDIEVGTIGDLYDTVNYPSLVTSANNLNSRLSDIEVDVGDWSTYSDFASEATIVAALNSVKSIYSTFEGKYIDATGDTMTGKLVADGGIGATTSLTLGVGAGTAITVNDQQRLGIGTTPHATYKVNVNGQLNATALSVGGQNADDRYLRNSSTGGTAEISAAIEHTGTTTFSEDITIGTELVYDHSAFTFSEYISDRVGDAFTSNSESGGISAVYNDATNKITLAIADDGHNHVVSNIDNFTEEVQDVVGGMVSSNAESGISVTYDDASGKLNFDVNDPTITLSGAITGSATMSNLGPITIATSITAEYIQDVIGAMITGNTETGMSVTYNDTTGKINFDNTLAIYNVSGTQVF